MQGRGLLGGCQCYPSITRDYSLIELDCLVVAISVVLRLPNQTRDPDSTYNHED